MTSFVFMLSDVPAPPWKTSTGNWSRQRPSSSTASQAQTIASAMSAGSAPRDLFARAAAFLTMTMPRTIAGTSVIDRPEIGKFSTARTVCTP